MLPVRTTPATVFTKSTITHSCKPIKSQIIIFRENRLIVLLVSAFTFSLLLLLLLIEARSGKQRILVTGLRIVVVEGSVVLGMIRGELKVTLFFLFSIVLVVTSIGVWYWLATPSRSGEPIKSDLLLFPSSCISRCCCLCHC